MPSIPGIVRRVRAFNINANARATDFVILSTFQLAID
jgi:hypothetical protein